MAGLGIQERSGWCGSRRGGGNWEPVRGLEVRGELEQGWLVVVCERGIVGCKCCGGGFAWRSEVVKTSGTRGNSLSWQLRIYSISTVIDSFLQTLLHIHDQRLETGANLLKAAVVVVRATRTAYSHHE